MKKKVIAYGRQDTEDRLNLLGFFFFASCLLIYLLSSRPTMRALLGVGTNLL